MKKIAVFGAGGLGREIPCIINKINEIETQWDFIGFFDDGIEIGTEVDGHLILGGLSELNAWSEELSIVFGIASPKIVKKIVGNITNKLIDFPNIISPDFYWLDKNSFNIGKGNFINFRCTASINVNIGDFNSIGAFTSLGHDSKIGNYNTIMPSVQVCGHVVIEEENFLGISSIILQGNHIGKDVTLGAGSILMKDAQDDLTYFGNPARPIIKK